MQITERIEKYWDTRSEDFSRVRMLEIAGADFLAWNEIIKKHLLILKRLLAKWKKKHCTIQAYVI